MKRTRLAAAILVSLAGAAVLCKPARAESEFSAYTGFNFAHPSDVQLQRPGGTNVTFFDVGWDGKSLSQQPPYYGLRYTYWLNPASPWGFGVDYTHAKVYARLGSTVGANGNLNGTAVPANVRLGSVFSQLEFTDGLNLLTAHAFYRFWAGSRIRPFVGASLGVSIPHVEVFMPGHPNTFRYEATGLAAKLHAGVSVTVYQIWSVFGEYQFSYAQVDKASLVGGGTLSTNLLNHHVNLGLSYSFTSF